MAVTFTNLDPNITTSEGGTRVVTNVTAYRGARASMYRSAADGLSNGKYYFEAKINAISGNEWISIGLGITGDLSSIATGYHVGNNFVLRTSPAQYIAASWSKAVIGDFIGVGFDLAAGTIIVSKNGVISSTAPGAVSSESYAPQVVLYTTGDDVSVNFGATAFNSLPVGYSAWDSIPRIAIPPIKSISNQRPIHFIRL